MSHKIFFTPFNIRKAGNATDKTITVYNPEYITTETRQKTIVRTLQEKFNFTKQQKIAIEIVFGLLVVIIALALRKMIRK